jgi:hypothetical protein
VAITRGDYVPLPPVIPRRIADTRTLGALLQQQGENALQYQVGKGQSVAQMWQQLGRLFSSYAEGRREDQLKSTVLAQRKQDQERDDQLKRDEFAERKAEREAAAQLRNDVEKRRQTEDAAKIGDEVAERVQYGPISEPDLNSVLQSPAQAGRARYSFGPGTAEGPELLPTRDQQEDINWRKQVEAKGGMVGPKGQAVMPPAAPRPANPNKESLAVMAANGDRGAKRALEIIEQHENATRAPAAPKAKFWIVRDGKQLRISEDEYKPGDLPASTREQGRPVTSGDAGRITELDTSLDDLGVLTHALTAAGSTGAVAKAGASMPNWVTEYTGWGTDAKKKQALIDRVKQVIGKALEGGVLRKEDEVKYEKILPTIGDPNDIVISKLGGISNAIKQRRSRTLDSLTDSGYDTSKFGEYKSPLNNGTTATPDLSGVKAGMGRKFTDGPFAGQTWSVDANGQPYKVGG